MKNTIIEGNKLKIKLKEAYEKEKASKIKVNISKLAKEYNIAYNTLRDWIKEDFELKSISRVFNKQEQKDIIELYKSGLSCPKIAKQYNREMSVVRAFLKRAGVYDNYGNRNIQYNPFNPRTSEGDYWLGYIIADGYLTSKKNNYTISLSQNNEDSFHLENYAKFLGKTTVHDNTSSGAKLRKYVQFANKETYLWMNQIGITNAKSGNIQLNIPMNRDILRGIFDGDGSVSENKIIKITQGSIPLLYQIMGFLDAYNISYKLGKDKSKNLPNHNPCYDLNIHRKNNNAQKFFDLLYPSNCMKLDRKFNKFIELNLAILRPN